MKSPYVALIVAIGLLFAVFLLAVLIVTRAVDWPADYPNPAGLIFLCLAALGIFGMIIERRGRKRNDDKN